MCAGVCRVDPKGARGVTQSICVAIHRLSLGSGFGPDNVQSLHRAPEALSAAGAVETAAAGAGTEVAAVGSV